MRLLVGSSAGCRNHEEVCGARDGVRADAIQLAGHRQLVGLRSLSRAIRTSWSWLRRSGDAGDLGPNLKGLGPGSSILGGGHLMAAEVVEVVDPVVGREEAPCLTRRLEPLHLPLSPSRGLVRGLRPVVQPLVPPVLDRGYHLALGRPAARQLVASVVAIQPRPLEQRGG